MFYNHIQDDLDLTGPRLFAIVASGLSLPCLHVLFLSSRLFLSSFSFPPSLRPFLSLSFLSLSFLSNFLYLFKRKSERVQAVGSSRQKEREKQAY